MILLRFVLGIACALPSYGADYIVKYKAHTQPSSLHGLFAEGEVTGTHTTGRLIQVSLSDDNQQKELRLNQLKKSSDIEYIVPNIKMHMFGEPNDPEYANQWALKKINASKAWEHEKGSADVVVAVIDTGIDWKHRDLKGQIWTNTKEIAGNGKDDDQNGFVDDVRGWDFFGNDNDPMDETSDRNPGHGTHCAGIVGATGDNGLDISGVAQNTTLMPIRFLGADGSGDLLNGAKAIDYAVQNGAHVISASWGAAVARNAVKPILEAIERAKDKGVLFVAAAANDGRSNDRREVYPANAGLSNVISVAASDVDDNKPSWSNFGRATVDLASPGADILSTLPGNKIGKLSGTSMATPAAAGLAALVVAKAMKNGDTLSPEHVKALMQTSASVSKIETACACRIDAEAAVKATDERKLVVIPNTGFVAPGNTLDFTAAGGANEGFQFKVDSSDVAEVTPEGVLTAKAEGEVTVTVTDADGTVAQSHPILIGVRSQAEECPLKNPMLCVILCQVQPTLPFCQ
ncbi:MAG: S8 family serine peptidase [Oligoflexales bacterium]